MNVLLKSILIIFISSGIFALLLSQLYKMSPKLFSFIEKIPEIWKGKWFLKWIIQLFLMTIVVVIFGGLENTIGKIIIGFVFALTDFVFSNSKKQYKY